MWNPAYATDAMSATLELLLGLAREFRQGGLDEEDDVYVWWGKVKSANRQAPLPHLKEVLDLDRELYGEDGLLREVHLYLTDYRSLYVGHLASVTADDILADENERAHVPAYYADKELHCDCWFQLFDIRRIVNDDTRAVIEELKKLRNTHYEDRPVSIYGGMVNLPLVVTREDGARFFEADVRAQLTGDRFWVEFDTERSGLGQLQQDLRDNLFGDDVWSALDPAARTFIATAESLYRAHRDDAAFDFGTVAVEFAKAFEVQVNTVLRLALRNAAEQDRFANIDGRTVDLTSGRLWSLGELAHAIADEQHVNRALKTRLAAGGQWFTASLPPILRDLAEQRNPAAHTGRVGRDAATELRNRLVGVGCPGVINELGRVRV